MKINWISTKDRIPDTSRRVLAFIDGEGTRVIVSACYLPRETVEVEYDWEEPAEFDDETETYYCAEGWYEYTFFHPDFAYLWIDKPVTHWCEIPEKPC